MSGLGPADGGDPAPAVLQLWLEPFREFFTAPTWTHAVTLVMGALLAPGKRTVTSCLRITGRAMAANFACYHKVLNRARWNPRKISRQLLLLLIGQLLDPNEPVVIGLDDTIERRWGPRIRARGIYRDPVRSSHGHFVKASGLRWLSFMLLTSLPWLPGIKALPFLTLLAPSERWAQGQGRRHKTLPERARQVMLMILRWLSNRSVIFVGDSSFGTHELAHAVSGKATLISRLRLDASLFAPPPPRTAGQRGRPPIKGKPLPKLRTHLDDPHAVWTPITVGNWYGGKKDKALEILSETAIWHRPGTPPKTIRWVLVRDPDGQREPQAFFSTDPDLEPDTIIALFVRRWQVEVTYQEARAHLGVETQRQWSDLAIERTTPALLGLYSLVCLWAGNILARSSHPFLAAWYHKTRFTFSDAIAAVRTEIWLAGISPRSPPDPERKEIPPPGTASSRVCGLADENDLTLVPLNRVKRVFEALCYAA